MAMQRFYWRGMNQQGHPVRGCCFARDETHVLQSQWQRHQHAISHVQHENLYQRWRRSDSRRSIANELGQLLQANMPLLDALHILQNSSHDPWVRAYCEFIQYGLHAGQSFSQLCAQCPSVFTTMDCQLLAISEQSNQLHRGLASLALYVEQTQGLQQQWQSAWRYPKVMLMACVLLGWMMLQWVLPHFVDLIQNMPHHQLSWSTRALCLVTQQYHQHTGLALALFAMGVGAVFVASRWINHHARQRLPFFHRIHRLMGECQLLNTLQLIASAQLPWSDAMGFLAERPDRDATTWQHIRTLLQQGKSLSQALKHHPHMNPALSASLEVASRSDQLASTLTSILGYSQQQCQQHITNIKQQLEPILTCLIGGGIALMIAALYLPLLNIGNQLW